MSALNTLRDFLHFRRNASELAATRRQLEAVRKKLKEKERELDKVTGRRHLRRERLQRQQGAARGDAPIFFVVGRSRSGTNWLMRTLDSHPKVLCRGEG